MGKDTWLDKVETTPAPRRRKELITLRLDADVIEWFRRQGNHGPRINALLKTYIAAQKESKKK